MNKNQTLRKDLIDAWKRYVNKTNTRDDLALILDSIRDDEHIQEFKLVFNNAWEKAMNDLQPTYEEKEMYRMEAAQLLAEYESKQSKRVSSRNIAGRFRKIWYAAAAALLLGLLIPAAYLYMKPKAEQTVQFVEEITGRGEIKTVFLPDQTEITLNVGSRIKYSANFSEDERLVELAGEALFHVTSDSTRPFIVKTENMNIRVVGTVFDVKEYADDLIASVSVASGEVEVNLSEMGRAASILLEQNRQLRMDKATGNFEKQTIDADKYMSWTNGALYFYRTPILEVVNILNRRYPQVDIELAEDEYAAFLISGEHENVFTAEEILKSIVYITGLRCKKTGENRYCIYK